MSDLAQQLRDAQRAEEAAMTAGERVQVAFALGRRDLERFAHANGVTLGEARRLLRTYAQAGRTPPKVMGEDR
jgi:hypothetical protein